MQRKIIQSRRVQVLLEKKTETKNPKKLLLAFSFEGYVEFYIPPLVSTPYFNLKH